MTLPLLSNPAVVTGPACVPEYHSDDHGIGIVHFGVGAFHRAHQAVVTDDALARHGGDWRTVGVSLRSSETANKLNAQNGLYTLIEKGVSATTARVVGSIDHVIVDDLLAALNMLCDPSIRIVTLTVTEAGYGINPDLRLPDMSNATVAADLLTPDTPKGVLGLLVAAIAKRRTMELPAFTLLSCDNLSGNGALLRDGLVGFARSCYDDELADWIANTVACPSCMVDRITPAPTVSTYNEAARLTGCVDEAAIETESYLQWIIEDNFPLGRPQWEAGGALFVNDVLPYEQMKLTMLNGCHSMLAYTGFLAGLPLVRDVMLNSDIASLVQRHFKAAADLLQPLPGVNFDDYALALTERFSNPSIAHETIQIATDGTQKLPQRIFQPAIEALKTQQDIRPFAFATAMWIRFCLQRRDDGTRYVLSDTRSDEIIAAVDSSEQTAAALIDAFHAIPQFIPECLAVDNQWRHVILEVLTVVMDKGVLEAIRHEATVEIS